MGTVCYHCGTTTSSLSTMLYTHLLRSGDCLRIGTNQSHLHCLLPDHLINSESLLPYFLVILLVEFVSNERNQSINLLSIRSSIGQSVRKSEAHFARFRPKYLMGLSRIFCVLSRTFSDNLTENFSDEKVQTRLRIGSQS